MTSSYLIVGGAGFIGSRLALRLIHKGNGVRILDDFSTGRRENLVEVVRDIDVREADLRNGDAVGAALQGIDRIVLLAAIPSVSRSVADPIGTHDVNVNGALTVLSAARSAGTQRFVFASSAAVYGRGPELPKHEGLRPQPTSPYGVAKLAIEQYADVFRQLYNLPTVSLRFFNVFGPHQNLASEYASAVPRFMRVINAGQRPPVYGSGQQSRDFIYVDNVVDAIILASEQSDPGGGPFNIGGGRSTTVLSLLQLIGTVLNRSVDPEFLPARPGDILASQADISRARECLGFEPRLSVEEGLRSMAAWMHQQDLIPHP